MRSRCSRVAVELNSVETETRCPARVHIFRNRRARTETTRELKPTCRPSHLVVDRGARASLSPLSARSLSHLPPARCPTRRAQNRPRHACAHVPRLASPSRISSDPCRVRPPPPRQLSAWSDPSLLQRSCFLRVVRRSATVCCAILGLVAPSSPPPSPCRTLSSSSLGGTKKSPRR